jgi:hypothetical protein
MYPSARTRELTVLLRMSRELDVCGDLTATVDNPSELIAWARVLTDAGVLAWRAQDSGSRFVHLTADHHRAPIRGHVTAVLSCEQHPEFWDALHLTNLEAGRTHVLSVGDLVEAWEVMPVTPPHLESVPEPPAPTDAVTTTETTSAEAHREERAGGELGVEAGAAPPDGTRSETTPETTPETRTETRTETTIETPAQTPAAT